MRPLLAALLGLLVACGDDSDEAAPRFRITSEGSGDAPTATLFPLRLGAIAIAPEIGDFEVSFAMMTRRTEVDGGDGVVVTLGPGEAMNTFRFDYVLDETDDGLVVRSAGGQIFDPPWLLIPREPREGMSWEIDDGAGHVLARGEVSRGAPIEYPRSREGEIPAIGETVTPWVVSFDCARAEEGTEAARSQGHYAIEPWQAPIRRAARGAPISPQAHFRDWNPLMPDGSPLRWTLLEGEGFVADTALLPTEPGETPSEARQPLTAIGDPATALLDKLNVNNVTVNRADPRQPGMATVSVWGKAVGFVPPDNLFLEIVGQNECLGAASDAWMVRQPDETCVDATHFELAPGDAPASAPTWFGYTTFERLFTVPNPLAPDDEPMRGIPLLGAFTGFYRAEDGTVRGLAHELDAPAITHDAEILANDAREEYTDRDFPAATNTYGFTRAIDDCAEKVGRPTMGEVLRTIALRPEDEDGVPIVVDSYPAVGHATLRRETPEGSPASAYLPDFQVDAWLPDPMTVVYEGEGRRSIFVAEAHGAIRELDIRDGALRWRSLGRPAVPDRHVVVAAYREGDAIRIVTQEDAAYLGFFEGVGAYTFAKLHAWTMPAREGAWEPLPTYLSPGVDALEGSQGLDRVVCAPEGVTIEGLALEGAATRVVETDDRCALVLRDGFPKGVDALLDEQASALMRGPATLSFTRSDLGEVRVRGRAPFVAIGGRHVVPRARWEQLRRDDLPTAPGFHYESLASPANDVFPGRPGLIDDGDGVWVVSYASLEACPENAGEPCFELTWAGESEAQTFRVPARRATVEAGTLPFDGAFEASGLVYPAQDEGLFVLPGYYVDAGGPQDLGAFCLNETAFGPADLAMFSTTSPGGARPPFSMRDGVCADASGQMPSRNIAGTAVLDVAPVAPGHRAVRVGLRDWRRGVFRSIDLDPDAITFLERFGGPVSDTMTSVGLPLIVDVDHVRRRLAIVHPHDIGSPWLLYATDAFLRPTELLAAGVAPPLERREGDPDYLATNVRPLALPFLPNALLREEALRCDDTEDGRSGACVCAFEHERDGDRCAPILGGSYRPAPGCAAIAEKYGEAPEWAYIDPDGTAGTDALASSATTLMRCTEGGLSALADPAAGGPVLTYDTGIVGAFDLEFRVERPGVWVGLFEAPLRISEMGTVVRHDYAEEPIAALLGDQPDRIDLPQRLLFRVRSEIIDLGPVVLGLYRWTRDDDGMMRITRDGTELIARALDVSPLFVGPSLAALGVDAEVTLAARGGSCLPEGRDYGAGLCALEPQTCEDRGHECGNGDDGAFGRIECGECEAGGRCEFARCVCRPDRFEPNDGIGYYQAWKLGVDEASSTWSRAEPGMTLDRADDVDKIEITGGDRAFMTANEFVVRLEGAPGVTYRLEAGLPTGCATSCAAGASTTMEPYIPPTRPPGCFVEGEGALTVRFRVQCDLGTVDADRGPYLVHVSSSDAGRAACVPYDLETEIVAASAFP